MDIRGKTAVIIGGASGLGKAFTEALLNKGANVLIGDVLLDTGHQTVQELIFKHGAGRVMFQKCDITKAGDINELFNATSAKWGGVDIFCPTAGIVGENRWQDVVNVNLNGTIQSTLEAMRRMGKDRGGNGGAIVLISSNAGYLPFPYGPVYAATKHGVMGFLRAYADELHLVNHGIHMTCLCPYATVTGMTDLDSLPQGAYLLFDQVKEFLQGGADTLLTPKSVADGFVRCIEDSTLHGRALAVKKVDGVDMMEVVQFP